MSTSPNINLLLASQENSGKKRSLLINKALNLENFVKFPELLRFLIDVIWTAAKSSESKSLEEKRDYEATKHSMRLIVASLCSNSDLLSIFYTFPQLKEFLEFVLLKISDTSLTAEICQGISELCDFNHGYYRQCIIRLIFD